LFGISRKYRYPGYSLWLFRKKDKYLINLCFLTELRIHDILVWIRIRGSMPLTNGSGSWILDPDPAIFVTDLQDANKKIILVTNFFCRLLFEGTFTSFFKEKKSKRVKNSRNQGFSYYFCMMIEGSGSKRPKNMWIWWIRIRNCYRVHRFLKHLPLPVSAAIRTSPPPRMRGMASAYKMEAFVRICVSRLLPGTSQNTLKYMYKFAQKNSINSSHFSQKKPWRFKSRTKLILLRYSLVNC
jgi:hypothetical protein